MKYLAVKHFATLQHYKHRNPVWIKLYARILTDPAFIRMPEAAQAQLMKLWVLASQAGNPLPNDPKFLARAIGSSRLQLDVLIASGFLIPTDDDSATLAECTQNASEMLAAPRAREEEEVETEVETETETEPTTAPRPPREEISVAGRLASDADRTAFTALLRVVPSQVTWSAEIAASLEGMPGHVHVTAEQAGQAIREYLGNGASKSPNLRQFRRYLEQAATQGAAQNIPRSTARPRTQNAAAILAQIKSLTETHQAQAGPVRIIRKGRVAELGDGVLKAYEAIGGADRVLATKAEHWGLLVRDFGEQLAAQGGT